MWRRIDRRWWPLLGLAVAAVAVGALLVADAGNAERRQRDELLVPDLRVDAVRVFTLSRQGWTLRGEKRAGAPPDGGWWLARDGAAIGRGDDAAIERLLAGLADARVERRAKLAPPAAGLAPPSVTWAAELEGAPVKRETRMALGGAAPGHGVYALRGVEVVVAGAHVKELLEVAPDGLRDSTLVAGAASATRRIRILDGGGGASAARLDLERRGARWQLAGSSPSRARPATVERLLGALGQRHAERFLLEVGAEKPELLVELDGRERARLVGRCGEGGTAVRRWDGAIGCFSDESIAPLREPAAGYCESRPWPLAPSSVRSLVLEDAGRRVALERTPEGWRMRAANTHPEIGPADEDAVRELLESLASASGECVAGPRVATGGPRLIGESDGGETVLLRLGDAKTGRLLVGREEEPSPIAVAPSFASLFDAEPLRFRPRRVLSLREADLRRITIEGQRSTAIERETTGSAAAPWKLVGGGLLDEDRWERLVAQLGELRAQRFLANSPSVLERPVRRLVIETRTDGGAAIHLQVGAPGTEGCRARLDGESAIFVLAPPVCSDLRASLER